jgi:UDPglucose 6-dehydrogenase
MSKKISVIGVGRLGLSFALLLDSKGYDVLGCDVNEKYVESLSDKSFSSNEPYINELLAASKMKFTTSATEALNFSDLVFTFVQTPSQTGGDYSHKYIDQIVTKIIHNGVTDKTFVVGSTVMPKYCDKIQQTLRESRINVIYNPEFIAQGSIIDGLKKSDIVLIGGENVPDELYNLYSDIMDLEPNFKTLSLTGAAIAKISINCFLTLKISFANLIGEIITNSWEEENMDSILDAIGSDSRIGKKCLGYGFPAGGVCLPRDQKALNAHAYIAGIHSKFFHAIDSENERHSEFLLRYYKDKNRDRSVPFIFSSLSYKKGVDILTHSYQLKLCIDLLRNGYKVDVPKSIKYADTPEEFKDYCYKDMVTFEEVTEGFKIN